MAIMSASTSVSVFEFLVVCGTYERNLYGLEAILLKNDDASSKGMKFSLTPIFIYPSHSGCIKCLGLSGRYLASGSTDEVIKLYDVKKRVELGSLLQHSGSISGLCFHGTTHMFSASEDGTICIWRTSDWECLKVLKGHKGSVNSIGIHPSGKLGLSVGKDKTLRMWNLLKGRLGFTTKLPKIGEKVLWNGDGTKYGILFDTFIKIYSADAKELMTIENQKRIISFTFYHNDFVLTANEDSLISAYKVPDPNCIFHFEGHSNRVREINVVESRQKYDWLVSISSDGHVKIWDLQTAIRNFNANSPQISTEKDQNENKKGENKGKEADIPKYVCCGDFNGDARFTALAVRSYKDIFQTIQPQKKNLSEGEEEIASDDSDEGEQGDDENGENEEQNNNNEDNQEKNGMHQAANEDHNVEKNDDEEKDHQSTDSRTKKEKKQKSDPLENPPAKRLKAEKPKEKPTISEPIHQKTKPKLQQPPPPQEPKESLHLTANKKRAKPKWEVQDLAN